MNYHKITNLITVLVFLCFFIFFSACNELLDKIIVPRNVVLTTYQSPKINDYKIKSVALFPLVPDDTTDNGTFYATNHFLNSLKHKFTNTKFKVPHVDSILVFDSLAVSRIIDSVETLRRLDLNYFYNTDLGYSVDGDTLDAVFLGIINKITHKKGYSSSRQIFRSYDATLTSCQFTYYLISLKDGRVLWKAQILGEEGFYLSGNVELYVPLDYAISNGIDKVIDKIPITSKKDLD